MRTYPRAKCAAIALLAVALGCSSSPKHDYLWRSARPLGAEATAARPPLDPAPAVPSSEAEAAVEAPASLTLDAAVGLALAGSPELAAAGWDVRVAEAAAWQAGFRSNPEIAIESEKILGSGGRSGFDSAAASMTLEYTLPLGGKRGKRVSAADAQGRLMAWDYEAARLDIYTDTRKAFLAAVVAQEREALAVRTVELAVGALDTVTAQVAAGRSPAIERTRAEMAVVEAESVLRTSGNAVSASYSALAARWGATVVNFERVDGALTPPVEPPPAAEARNGLAQAPALARYSDALDALDSAVAVADAEGAPDIGVGVGGQYSRDVKERSFLIELGIPLPVFDTNQGGVAEARAAAAKGRMELRHALATTHATFERAYSDLLSAYHEAVTTRDELMPRAQELLDKTMAGYKAGKFRYFDALAAQEEFVETQEADLQARAAYAMALAEVERLIARELHDTESAAE